MRTVLIALAALAVNGAVVVGARQARDSARAGTPGPLSRAEVSKPIPGAPAKLAALQRQVGVLRGGTVKAFDAQLRALRGYPVVVNFWASWCAPCRRELPSFQREARRRGTTVAFLGVNSGDDRDAALKLAREFPMPYPSFADPRFNIALGRFGTRVLPITAFFDARGKQVIVRQGELASREELASAIDRYALR